MAGDAVDQLETAKRSRMRTRKRVHYKSYDPKLMEKAIREVQHDGKTMYRASKDHGVPMNTLRDRLIAKGLIKPKHLTVYREPVALASKRKRMLKERTQAHIILDNDLLERWQSIGMSERLTNNAAIIRFLVSLYYSSKKLEVKSEGCCHQCNSPLTLFCTNCQLISSTTQDLPSFSQLDKSNSGQATLTNLQPSLREQSTSPQFGHGATDKHDKQDLTTLADKESLMQRRLRRSAKKSRSQTANCTDEEPSGSGGDTFEADDLEWHEADEEREPGVRDAFGDDGDDADCLADSAVPEGEEEEEQLRGKNKVKTHECLQCGARFWEAGRLREHAEESRHSLDYVCLQCDKPFKNKSALQQHRRVHNRQDHQCSICGLSFKFPSRLNKHIKTHGTDKPHVCDKCGKSFVSVYYLRDHIKIHSDERRYKCEVCGAAFKQKPALYAHGKKHTNERPFQCQYCGLKFRDSQKVKIHVRTHTGEKPYKCDLCDASFVSNSNMWQHCAYVHGKSTKTHQCPHCPLTFAAKGKLKVHLKNVHGGSGADGDADVSSCQYQMMCQAVQPMYIELPGSNQLVQI